MDAYGREYWIAREVQPLMGYPRWQHFEPVIDRARKAASNVSDAAAVFTEVRENPSELGGRPAKDFRLSRAAAYYVAMNGDPDKAEVAAAQAYFVRRTREAELGAITLAEVRQTALARAREMVDYRLFRDMMAENAPDYEPSSRATQLFFAATQNKLYLQVVGMTAQEIKEARCLATWPGAAEGKPEPSAKSAVRKVAKNYLSEPELRKLNRLVGRLCLRAEDIADDGLHLSLVEWRHLVEVELRMLNRQIAA
ncbi:RhuM family protein [Streptomyces stelliscabiei]|uniref:RhuM family protein n=2 Tax=Streptomyces stelliscabiei TaxID=146820 RepID=UPI00069998B2|nr:RhuM family protein [Streptomyces stelliscabiei]MDX2616161.1 RhuM family protein [Streptomyces stelliscabiei]MDX2634151.1 RhuM family protein [Streptomyces stelliscabiei]MDX2713799.1 RhuM family protein [Streptomyces stelliscabiei]MDX3434969.1 RhuM family protein [Streptomyces stelliscabiei]MDX3620715.1 RhuM family protein [Streptomyces stelliscabiei]